MAAEVSVKTLYLREIDARRLIEPFEAAIRRIRDEDGLLCGMCPPLQDGDGVPDWLLKAISTSVQDGPIEVVVMADPWPYDENGQLRPSRGFR